MVFIESSLSLRVEDLASLDEDLLAYFSMLHKGLFKECTTAVIAFEARVARVSFHLSLLVIECLLDTDCWLLPLTSVQPYFRLDRRGNCGR